MIADRVGFPLLVRPSLRPRRPGDGDLLFDGRARDLPAKPRPGLAQEHPLLLDRFLENAIEIDVDALCDGDEVYIAGIMQHVEEAGVHSGDSACVLPPMCSATTCSKRSARTTAIAIELGVIGLINIQYAIADGSST